MNMDKFNEMLLESVGVGLAILDPGSREILVANRRFCEWFPGTSGIGQTLDQLFPDLDYDRLHGRLDDERPFTAETEIKVKRRTTTLGLQISRHTHHNNTVLILECQNISKLKEL
jgi:adenylate cyclase